MEGISASAQHLRKRRQAAYLCTHLCIQFDRLQADFSDGFESKSIAWLTPRLANDGFMRIETTVTVSTCQAGAFRDRARSANKPNVERPVTVDPLRPVHKER